MALDSQIILIAMLFFFLIDFTPYVITILLVLEVFVSLHIPYFYWHIALATNLVTIRCAIIAASLLFLLFLETPLGSYYSVDPY